MLFKLSLRNVRRQINNYLIYFITVSLTIALLFAVNNLIFSDFMTTMSEMTSDLVQPVLVIVSVVISVVVAFVLSYATAFLLRRRKKEFGLYLTLGMTRGNILTIFAGETAVFFLVSLGVGMLLGLVFYQALMLVFVNFMRIQYELAGYSLFAVLLTVFSVIGMFFLSLVASLGYLRFSKISTLLYGDKKTEKGARLPSVLLWSVLFVLGVAGLTWAVFAFVDWYDGDFWNHIGELVLIIVVAFASVFVIPVGFSKVVITVALRCKKLSSRGTARFTLRQLSGRLTANSLMMGTLTVLLTVAVIAPNVFFVSNASADLSARITYPFDVSGSYQSGYYSGEFGDTEEWYGKEEPYADPHDAAFACFETIQREIEELADVDESHTFIVYRQTSSEERWGETEYYETEYYLLSSDFSRLCAMLGYTMPALNGEYLECVESEDGSFSLSAADGNSLAADGVTYSCAGTLACPNILYAGTIVILQWRVVPDEAVDTLSLQEEQVNFALTLKNDNFDAWALYDAVGGQKYFPAGIAIREYERLDSLAGNALFLLGDLFVSAVFLLLTMAMLALKILSMVTEDRERYRAIWRLGASEGMAAKSLFSQMFFFYFLPFALPLAGCIPLALVLIRLAEINHSLLSAGVIVGQIAAFASVVLLLYALYFAVTYFVAWRDIRSSLRQAG